MPAVEPQLLFDLYLPRALLLPEAEITGYHGDLLLALDNARTGVDAVLAHEAVLRKEQPAISIPAIESLSEIGSALSFAVARVERYAPPSSTIRTQIARGWALRSSLLDTAEVLVRKGVFDPKSVQAIRSGTGPLDAAGDCMALAELFRAHAAEVEGMVPFVKSEVKEAAELGGELLRILRPDDAPRRKPEPDLQRETRERDVLWSLFEQTWERQVWRAGAWLFCRAVDEHVPPLRSRVVKRCRTKAGSV